MTVTRRSFTRASEAQRRDDLIAAALDCIAEDGPAGTTVRAIAGRAGVTPGLIRHYFHTKEDLIAAAYASLMAQMTADTAHVLHDAPADPLARLAAFVVAALSPPVLDARAMGLWAGFIHTVQHDAAMRAVHGMTYLGFRDRLQALIAEALADRAPDAATLRRHAIACNAVIDGLWLEGCALPEGFAPGEIPQIGLRSVGAILGLGLGLDHSAEPAPCPEPERTLP